MLPAQLRVYEEQVYKEGDRQDEKSLKFAQDWGGLQEAKFLF